MSYLNALPLVYGLKEKSFENTGEVLFQYPSMLAQSLIDDVIDVALVPVATIPLLPYAEIISDYCIGASGPVATVCLFSDVPLREITQVYADYQSRSSVALLKILIKEHWKIEPEILQGTPGFEEKISGTTAGLVIGDRAFIQAKKSTYAYDLAEHWIAFTGLPFVFAAWIANKKLPACFVAKFNEVTASGLQHLPEIAASANYRHYDLLHYYRHDIDYTLDAGKRKGLALFLQKLSAY